MNQDQIENVLAFRAHEAGTDAAGRACDAWLRWAAKVEAILGHDLDGDQDSDGYSIDGANDLYEDGCSPQIAATEFRALKLVLGENE